jgi:hypothetical protein
MKISEEEVNALIEDERKARDDYERMGFPRLASDENRHFKFWLKYRKLHYKGY